MPWSFPSSVGAISRCVFISRCFLEVIILALLEVLEKGQHFEQNS